MGTPPRASGRGANALTELHPPRGRAASSPRHHASRDMPIALKKTRRERKKKARLEPKGRDTEYASPQPPQSSFRITRKTMVMARQWLPVPRSIMLKVHAKAPTLPLARSYSQLKHHRLTDG